MKTLNFKFLLFALVASLAFLTSCKKDKDNEPVVINSDSLVGTWNVSGGTADLYVSGELLAGIELTTSGTMEFNGDGTGSSDFSIDFAGEKETAVGSFTWERDGFELIVDEGDGPQRWVMVDDEKDMKTIQYTDVDEEEDTEVEVSLTLTKKK